MTAAVLALLQLAVPPPRGFVNDFASVLGPGAVARLDSTIAALHARTDAEIAVVTLRDLGGRSAADVAVHIGREWRVGAQGEAGDPRRNLGVVILLKPLENGRPGTGELFIATGRGAEGVLPDARVGRIRDVMTPYLGREDYAAGLAVGVDSLAAALAEAVSGAPAPGTVARRTGPLVALIIGAILVLFILFQIIRVVSSSAAPRRRRHRRRFVWIGGRGGWG
ncbi:MAG TPA: TPM domain-containing protein, partial [Gemmatimonadales bacterium]|nr:TPM domain-containing protein [Gemmatimonadales bacterium]